MRLGFQLCLFLSCGYKQAGRFCCGVDKARIVKPMYKPDLKPFSTSCGNSLPKHRTDDLQAYSIERIHQSLHPYFKDLVHELLDCFLGLGAGRIVRDGC
jgi:hypothetical protein